jgi:hypothetical protein
MSRYQHRRRGRWARKNLLDHLSVEDDIGDWSGGKVEVCHLCEHNTTNGLCLNPLHVYLGNRSENRYDMPPDVRARCGHASVAVLHATKDEDGKSLHARKMGDIAHQERDENGKSILAQRMGKASHREKDEFGRSTRAIAIGRLGGLASHGRH